MSRRIWFGFGLIVLLVLAAVLYFFYSKTEAPTPTVITFPVVEKIGQSVQGRDLETYTFGTGSRHLIFIGAIHGGYEPMTALLAYEVIDFLKENPIAVSSNQKVTIIPALNPDGLFRVVGKEGRFLLSDIPSDIELTRPGRFNANNVDLNRNFDCLWTATSSWQNRVVSGGAFVFSEPEARAFRDYIISLKEKPVAVIFWHSQANAVYGGGCGGQLLPETLGLLNTYAGGAGYRAIEVFDEYVVTGAAEDWLSKIGIPTITVELKSHYDMEWAKNLAGLKATLGYYSK